MGCMKLTKEQTERALKQTGMIFVHVYKRERKPVVRGVWDYIGGDEVDGGEGAVDCAKDSIRRKPVCYTYNFFHPLDHLSLSHLDVLRTLAMNQHWMNTDGCIMRPLGFPEFGPFLSRH